MAKQELETAIANLKLTVESYFVPWSKSRNAVPKPKLDDRSLNWKVTLKKDGREIITTDYSAGIGHCPSYSQSARLTLDYAEKIVRETETGHVYRAYGQGKKVEPDVVNVIWCLVNDCDVLNYSTYEEYADSFGMDPDSRKGEKQYRDTLENALRVRNGLGDEALRKLQEAGEDY